MSDIIGWSVLGGLLIAYIVVAIAAIKALRKIPKE